MQAGTHPGARPRRPGATGAASQYGARLRARSRDAVRGKQLTQGSGIAVPHSFDDLLIPAWISKHLYGLCTSLIQAWKSPGQLSASPRPISRNLVRRSMGPGLHWSERLECFSDELHTTHPSPLRASEGEPAEGQGPAVRLAAASASVSPLARRARVNQHRGLLVRNSCVYRRTIRGRVAACVEDKDRLVSLGCVVAAEDRNRCQTEQQQRDSQHVAHQ